MEKNISNQHIHKPLNLDNVEERNTHQAYLSHHG